MDFNESFRQLRLFVTGSVSQHRLSPTAGHGAQDRHEAESQQDPMRAMQPRERDLWPGGSPTIKMTAKDEGLGHEQDECKQQSHANHGMHPPKVR